MSGLSQLLAALQPVTASSYKVLLVLTLGSQTLFSFCCTCVYSSMYTKEQPWQSFLVCRPILFYVGCVYRYIHGHICTWWCTCVQRLENHSGYFPLLLSTSVFETRSSQNLELADSAAAPQAPGTFLSLPTRIINIVPLMLGLLIYFLFYMGSGGSN